MRLFFIAIFLIVFYGQQAHCAVSAIIAETHSGRIIFQHEATKLRHPASLTKMMTLYIMFDALEAGKISLKDKIKFSPHASAQPACKLWIKAGDSITVEEAILSLIVLSANDVATAVAEWMGKGSEKQFIKIMNTKAQLLGMHDTVFRNAHGLHHPEQLTTAKDMAKLAISLKVGFPQYYHYFSRSKFTFRGRVKMGHNAVVTRYKEVDGLKTGYIKEAGYNLATSVTNDSMNIISVLMGGESVQTRDALMGFLINAVATRKTGQGLTDTRRAGTGLKTTMKPAQRSTHPHFPVAKNLPAH